MSFVDFLLARLDEIEAAAAAERAHPGMNEYDDDTYNSPARVLADVEAKRRIVARMVAQIRLGRQAHGWDNWEDMARRTLQDLASVYADHPDYDEGDADET